MATENNIVYKISVDAETATATIRRLNGTVVAGAIPVKELRKEFGNLATQVNATRFNKFNKELKNATTNNQEFAGASGGATSAVLELGRVVQDAPYGIRGMANNITQLASQMAFATKSAGSFKGALREMGKAMMGPLGIVFAISVIVSLMDGLYGGFSKAEKQVNSFNDALVKNSMEVERMRALRGIVNDNTASLETQKDALEELKKLGFDPAKRSLDEFIESQQKLAVVNASIKAIEENLTDLMKERLKLNAKAKKEFSEYYKMKQDNSFGIDIQEAVLDQIKLDKNELDKKEAELKKQFQDLIKRSFDLTDAPEKKGRKKKKLKFILKDPKEFDKELETLGGMALEYYQKSLVKQAENGLDRLKAEKSNEEDRLKALKESNEKRFEEQAEAAKKEYDTYLKLQVAKGNITEIERQKKQLAFNDSVNLDVANQKKAAEESYKRAIKALNFLYDGLFKAEKEKQAEDKKRADLEIWKAKLDAMRDYAAKAKEILSSVASFIDGEFDRELATEKNKTNAINNELNQRLLNENLSKDERKSIQNQIAKNDELLRQKQEKVEKRRFEMNKAANIAKSVVDTYSAAVAALKNNGGVPSGLPAMFGTIAVGLAQVATIARQKFVSSAGARTPVRGGGGGSSSGGNDRSFNFNLVGNTQANQIADAIQGRFKQPLKAFVVSRDITTQQELDANIKGSASF